MSNLTVLRDTLARNHQTHNRPEEGLKDRFKDFCELFDNYYSGRGDLNVKKD